MKKIVSAAPPLATAARVCPALLLVAMLWVPAVRAATIYRWVDEAGVTHVSDKVPEKFKRSAKVIDSRGYELSERERRTAADEANRLVQAAAKPAPAPVPASAPAAAGGAGRVPAPKPVAGDECEVLWRTYYNAVACWDQGPKTRWGNPNMAFSRNCPDVVDPSSKCGTPKLRPQDRVADYPTYAPGDAGRWKSGN